MNEELSSWGLKSCGSIKTKFMFWEWITIKFSTLHNEEKRSRSHRFGGGDLRQGLERQGQKQGGGRQEANVRRFKGTKLEYPEHLLRFR